MRAPGRAVNVRRILTTEDLSEVQREIDEVSKVMSVVEQLRQFGAIRKVAHLDAKGSISGSSA